MKKFLLILTILAMSLGLGDVFAQEIELSQKVSELTDKLAFAVEGYVLGVAGETVYIDLGQNAGIVEGIKFEVVRLDKKRPFKRGEKIIGYPETEVGEIEITKVRKEVSLAKVTEKIMDIQEGDKAYQKMKKVTRVAITEFTYGDELNDFTKNVQDILYTNLIQRGMAVVEREKLEQVLEEQKTSFTGMIDLATAAKIGKMLGVEAVVVGTVADMGNSVDIRARLVDVEKGVAITAAQIGVVKNPTIIGLLGTGARRAVYGVARLGVTKEGEVTTGHVAIGKVYQMGRTWRFTLASYQILENRDIQFNLVIENQQDRPADLRFYPDNETTYLLDNLTKKYFSPILSVEPKKPISFIQGMPVTISVTFLSLQEGVEEVALYLDIAAERVEKRGLYPEQLYFGPIELE